MKNQANQISNSETSFNFVACGIGYLNESYLVRPRKGEPYRCVKLNALEGVEGSTSYVPLDLAVSDFAAEMLDFVEQTVREDGGFRSRENPDGRQVIVAFRMGVKGVNAFTKADGTLAGSIRGRLIRITSLSLDGESIALPEEMLAQSAEMSEPEPVRQTAPVAPISKRAEPASNLVRPAQRLPTSRPASNSFASQRARTAG